MKPANPGDKGTWEIRIAGQKVPLKATGLDPELARETIDLVARKIAVIELRARNLSPHHIAVLALVDLAEEYVKSKQRTVEFKQQVEEKISRLSVLLEKGTLAPSAESHFEVLKP
ncbi:cell division protein ZapA [Bdellovibrionota bacterium FG-2]